MSSLVASPLYTVEKHSTKLLKEEKLPSEAFLSAASCSVDFFAKNSGGRLFSNDVCAVHLSHLIGLSFFSNYQGGVMVYLRSNTVTAGPTTFNIHSFNFNLLPNKINEIICTSCSQCIAY